MMEDVGKMIGCRRKEEESGMLLSEWDYYSIWI